MDESNVRGAERKRRARWPYPAAFALAIVVAACGSSGASVAPATATCPTGSTLCGALCVATQTDNANCGTCGNSCPAGEVCSAGACGATCAGGATLCGTSCVETAVDPSHCGTCGNACPAGRACSAGTCGVTCLGGSTLCSDRCVDTQNDPLNCGGCGTLCASKQTCRSGQCVVSCTDGVKNGNETDVDCGGSCGPCATGRACLAAGDCASALCTGSRCEACADVAPFASLTAPTAFDGSQAGIVDLGPVTFPASFDFTFTGRVNATNLNSFGRIFDFGPATGANAASNFRFHQNSGAPTGTGRVAVGQFDYVLDVPTYWSYGNFIGVAVKYQSSTQTLTLYKNGTIAGTKTSVVIPAGARTNLLIGGSNWGGLPSTEPPAIMTTSNLRFVFAALSDACIAKLTQ